MSRKGEYVLKGKAIKSSIVVAVVAAMMQVTPAFASPVDSKVTQGQIDSTKEKINNLETKIQKLDNDIIIAMDKSQQLNDNIKAEQGKIEETKVEITKAQKDLDAHKQVYLDRLKSLQSQGQQPVVAYAEMLFSSDNLSEFLTRFTAISDILQSDSDLLNGLKEKEQALNNAKEKLSNELDQLKKSQEELASEQQQIKANKEEIEKELTDSKDMLQSQQSQYAQQKAQELAKRLAEQQAAQQRAQQQAQQHAQTQQQSQHQTQPKAAQHNSSATKTVVSTPTASASGLSSSAKASKVIAAAEQYLGVPYVWGGSSPSGFDCSGLMQYVFHTIGISLPRVARAQQDVGTRISPSQVRPGDLVFMGDPAYHVGMYIGGGKWIEAPQTGDVVKIATYRASAFSSAARVIR